MYEHNRFCIVQSMVHFTERLMILLPMICVSFAASTTDFIIGCEDTESDCYELIPPCTENERLRCLKTCGTCSEIESVFSYDNKACADHPGCVVYKFPNDCSSSILTWPRERCLLSCNLCPSYQKPTAAVNITASKPDGTTETRTVDPNKGVDGCMDRWPYCHSIAHNCTKLSVKQSTIEKWCSKTCGICKGMETMKKSMGVTCEDDVDCSPYNLTSDCPSNNTWFQEHCAKSCNMCLYVTTLHVTTNVNEGLKSRFANAMDVLRVTYDVTTIVVAGITAFTVIIIFLLFLHKNKAEGCRIRQKSRKDTPKMVTEGYSRVQYQSDHIYNEIEEESMLYSGEIGRPGTEEDGKPIGTFQTHFHNELEERSDAIGSRIMSVHPYMVPAPEYKTDDARNDYLQPISATCQSEHELRCEILQTMHADLHWKENKDNYIHPCLPNISAE